MLFSLLTVEVGLVWVVHQYAVVVRVADAVAVTVRIALVTLAIAVRVKLIGVGHFRAVVYTVLDTVSVRTTSPG